MAKKNRKAARMARRDARANRAVSMGLSQPSLKQPPKKQKKHAKERREESQKRRKEQLARAAFEKEFKRLNPPRQQKASLSIDEEIERTLKFIKDNPNTNVNRELSNRLIQAIELETGINDIDFINNRETDLYKIDDTWDGNYNSLISHVTFKKDFTNPEAEEALKEVTESNWGSEELYKEHLEKAASKAYDANTEGMKELKDLPTAMLGLLENIMNDSKMWRIVGDRYHLDKDDPLTYDSKQSKKDWDNLHKKVTRVMKHMDAAYASEISEMKVLMDNYQRGAADDTYDKIVDLVDNMLDRI